MYNKGVFTDAKPNYIPRVKERKGNRVQNRKENRKEELETFYNSPIPKNLGFLTNTFLHSPSSW